MSSAFRYDGRVQSTSGFAIPGVSIAVLSQPALTTTQPGSPLASIFAAATSNAATITAASWLAGIISFTFSAPPPADVVAGSFIGVTLVNPTGYNGIWQVIDVVGNVVRVTTPFTLVAIADPGAYVSGGTVATSALPNPFFTDALGNFRFYAAAGIFTVQIYDTQSRLPTQLVLLDQNVVAGGGSGSVTSVALTMPAEFAVVGSPIVGAGTLAVTKAVQNPNLVYAGPGSGGAVAPTFRSLVTADLPAGLGTVTSVAFTLAVPAALFAAAGIVGSPITTNGTIAVTLTLQNQTANTVFAGATSGGAAPPTFRALVPADMPTGLQFTSTTLSSAQILALLGTPITLVPAPGAGFVIVPVMITIEFFGGTVAYTDAGGAVSIGAGSASAALASNAIFLVTASPNKRFQTFPWPGATDTAANPPTDENAVLTISKATNNFAAGTGTAKVIVHYLVLPTT
jgi:hypothetical protein